MDPFTFTLLPDKVISSSEFIRGCIEAIANHVIEGHWDEVPWTGVAADDVAKKVHIALSGKARRLVTHTFKDLPLHVQFVFEAGLVAETVTSPDAAASNVSPKISLGKLDKMRRDKLKRDIREFTIEFRGFKRAIGTRTSIGSLIKDTKQIIKEIDQLNEDMEKLKGTAAFWKTSSRIDLLRNDLTKIENILAMRAENSDIYRQAYVEVQRLIRDQLQ